MKRNYLSLLILLLLLASCSKKNKMENVGIDENQTGFSVFWNGKVRLQGVYPVLQGSEFTPDKVELTEENGNHRFSFTQEDRNVHLNVSFSKDKSIATFSISPNGNHSKKGEDFIGLFFKALPGYKTGTTLFKYRPVKAWTKPIQIQHLDSMPPEDNQFFFWKFEDSTYAAAMPLGGKGYSSTLGTDQGKFGVKALNLVNNKDEKDIPLMAIAFGKDPYKMIDDLIASGMETMGVKENLRRNKKFPETFEYIGWCTWNALGHDLNEKKILDAVETFRKNNFKLPFLLIDDGWLTISGANGKLRSFKADSVKFPAGFKPTIDKLKNQYGVKNIGVWHTLNGYWAGVDPTSELGEQYKDILVPYQDKVTWTETPVETFYAPTPHSGKGQQFYDDWYTYLKSQGISFVKVDNQLVTDRIARNKKPLWDAGQQLQSNLQTSVQKHFNGSIINCMEMTVDALYHYKHASIARAVEDYFPEERGYNMQRGNEAVHVLCANYNSLWYSPMVWPDFDMFETHHQNAPFHAVARAISGGPIYLTDSPGKQNFELIKALCYKDGRIIRTDVPSRPTEDCLFQVQDAKPFKAFSFSGKAGLLGVWNCADADEVKGTFRATDLYGIEGEKFAVYDYFNHTVELVAKDQAIPVSLKRLGYKFYYVVPLENETAVFGLVNKYNAPATILSQKLSNESMDIVVPEGGQLSAYFKTKPIRVEIDGMLIKEDAYTWTDGLLNLSIEDNIKLNKRKVKVFWK